MKGAKFDPALVLQFLTKMKHAKDPQERGAAVRWFRDLTGVSASTAYSVLRKAMRKTATIDDIANAVQCRKARKLDLERAMDLRVAKTIVAFKILPGKNAKPIPTEHAMRMAVNMGHSEVARYTRSTVDRHIRSFGLSPRYFRGQDAGMPITAKYPGHVFAVDATPIDHYYLKFDESVVPYDAIPGDKHLDDILARERLYKIWVYYLVDMYSRCFLVRPYAELPKTPGARNAGESAETWLNFMLWCIKPKHGSPSPLEHKKAPFADCPVEGAPDILYCDRGSGIGGSSLINRVMVRLGVSVVTHLPGNPRAKGIVEGRIGAFKRSYEPLLRNRTISSLNELIYFYQAWADDHNRRSGFYDAWMRGAASNPVIRISEKNIKDAMVSHADRKINGMGCVEIDKQVLFVAYEQQYLNTWCAIHRARTRDGGTKYIAELSDGTIKYPKPVEQHAHDFSEFRRFPKTEEERNREDVSALSSSIEPFVSFNDTLPLAKKSNVVRLPSPAKPLVTHSVFAPQIFDSADAARTWILTQARIFWEQINNENRESIEKALEMSMRLKGHIPGSMAVELANILIEDKATNTQTEGL